MKKILFLTRSYPNTRRSASVLCTHRVLDGFAKSNEYEVHVLCCKYKCESKFEKRNNLIIHRFIPSLWMKYRNNLEETSPKSKIDRIMEVVQKIITIPVYPLLQPITIIHYYFAAKQLQKKELFDIVVSEHHSLETLLVGCLLKRNFDLIKHVSILWDPIKGEIATSFLPVFFTNSRINKIEIIAANYTTLLISMESIRNYYQIHGDISADHRIYLNIPAIIPPEPEVATVYLDYLKSDKINMVFSGALSNVQRNPIPIIRLLNETDYAEKINIVFFSKGAKDKIANEAKLFKGTIIYSDYISLNELHTIYRHSDYLLNISHINANMIPSKIFEYMSFGKPIISAFVTEGDAAQKYLNLYPESLCVDLKRNSNENVICLNDFLSMEHRNVPFIEVKELFKDNTPTRYYEVINEL